MGTLSIAAWFLASSCEDHGMSAWKARLPWNIVLEDYLNDTRFIRRGMSMRSFIVAVVVASMTDSAFAQTQPTQPSAYATFPTMRSAFATAPLSPCYGWSRGRHFAFFHDYPRNGGRHRWSSFNPTSPCYTGTPYPSYSAIEPFESLNPTNRPALPGSASLDEDQAKLRIEAKGYLDLSGLERDRRGIWRGKATMNDGRAVDVILDLEGNVYSELSRLYIRIQPPPSNR
jgi:hypothetical protein